MTRDSERADRLRALIIGSGAATIMQVHDGISAKVAERTGFQAIWASSFGISTACGVPDDDRMPMTDYASHIEAISGISSTPMLVDGNCGFGSLDVARRFVARVTSGGAAGVCFEDKRFPKKNSYYAPEHPLVSTQDYCDLLSATRAVGRASRLVVVARTESLVAGESIEVTVERCAQYAHAGAEALFVSYVETDVARLCQFLREWRQRLPVIVNPVSYMKDLPLVISAAPQLTILWANQNIRACVHAMQTISGQLFVGGTRPTGIEQLASMAEVFEVIGYGGAL